ncbi:MAG: isoprenylcysteine carboxylmethyltransferase family protein [Clostridia bacterium]|nr:isoprenylcysteine carboxylmethyltransferase family protein [Clostridia bacterium]
MTMKLLFNAIMKFTAGFVLLAFFLFLPAGTIAYPKGWLFLGLLFVPMLFLGIFLFLKAPALLEKRLNAKEKESTQKGVVAVSGLIFAVGFILAGLDFRFGFSKMPFWVTVAASAVFLIAYALYAEVMRENAYLSRTIEVQKDQKVIDTGLYGIVRHPMYFATVLLFLVLPLVLGSWISFAVFCFYPVPIIIRILNEEKILAEELDGYRDYQKKIRYRLIPFIW